MRLSIIERVLRILILSLTLSVNSWWPKDTIHRSIIYLVRIMACRLFGAMPLPDVLTQCSYLNTVIFTHENAYENILCKIATIDFRPLCIFIPDRILTQKHTLSWPLRWWIFTCPFMQTGLIPYQGPIFLARFNTLRPRQNGRQFPDDIFKCIFFNGNI